MKRIASYVYLTYETVLLKLFSSATKMVAFGVLTVYVSTYIDEKTFSNMNSIKN